jgi:Protein of unknown function (DUF3494).
MALPASASQIAGKTNGRPESPQGVGTAPTLGLAAGYAVLGGSTITNTGNSVINGNLGLSPGTSVTGFPPGIVNGTQHVTDTAAANAQSALVTAYNALTSQSAGSVDLTGQDLGGLTLTPGVYRFSSSAGLTGTLTLNAQGDPNSVFIFLIGSTLTTASNSIVSVINGGSDCNVFWQVGSSATLGTATTFVGNILALTDITLTTGANVKGSLLARNGAVTLDTNNVSLPICSSTTTTLLSATTITIGGSITDTATVTNAGVTPTGTVIFKVSSDGGATFAAFGATGTLNGSGQATSASYTPTPAGTYYFQAVYSGDANYPGSQSGTTAEPLVVNPLVPGKTASVTATLLSATSITIGDNVIDAATVTGTGVTPTGTVIFKVSPDGTTFTAFGATKTLDGSGKATSDSYTPALTGTYYFLAIYSGDANYNGSQSGNTAEPLVVNPLVPGKSASATATLLSATTITIGDNVTDAATVTGTGVTPTGTVIFKVSSDGGATFTAFGATKTLDGSGKATSDSYTPTSAGTYYFQAVYSGDASYNGSQSGNTAEPLVIVNTTSTPPPTTTSTPASCPPVPCPSISLPQPDAGIVTGVVASVPEPSGATNEYNLYIKIVSTGQMVWVAAKTTAFPALLTVGTTLTGDLNHSLGWWVLSK